MLFVKRVRTPPFNEVAILRTLAANKSTNLQNHVALPVSIIWSDRLMLMPQYHASRDVRTCPNEVLNYAKQLTEVRISRSPPLPRS